MPRTGIMLCYPFEEARLNRWGTSHYIYQDKLNGDRGRIILDPDNILILSSEEKLRNFSLPHIAEQAKELCKILNAHGIYELDGEFYRHGLEHEEIHSIVSRTKNLHPMHTAIEFHIFDHILSDVSQFSRVAELHALRSTIQAFSAFKLVRTVIAHSISDIMEFYSRSLYDGYEGMIIRNVNACYVRKRSVNIMKFKPGKSDIYEILGVKEEISLIGEPKARVGAIVCTSDEGTIFSVSAGMNDEEKKSLWSQREKLIGRKVKVFYQATSANGVPKFATDIEIL